MAVADPDEWDDMDHLGGLFNAFLSTSVINVSGAKAGSLQLTFASSWRQEDMQTAIVTVDMNNPHGAKTMVITFGMLDAGNDWWWAIDSIEVRGVFAEFFP